MGPEISLRSITWASGRGLSPGNLEFLLFGPQMALAYRLDAILLGPKNSQFPGPAPSSCPRNGSARIKNITHGPYKSQVHKQLISAGIMQSARRWFSPASRCWRSCQSWSQSSPRAPSPSGSLTWTSSHLPSSCSGSSTYTVYIFVQISSDRRLIFPVVGTL